MISIWKVRCGCDVVSQGSDVADEMEYDERLAQFRQTRLNPFDRGEDEDGPRGGRTPPQKGDSGPGPPHYYGEEVNRRQHENIKLTL